MNRAEFRIGDRVIVGGGYDGSMSEWLQGGVGYCGVIVEMAGAVAVVRLDDELVLRGEWQNFGGGSARPVGTVAVARGRWLALLQGWVGGTWTNPTGRLQVGLCAERPRPSAIPTGGGIGCWIESHAGMQAAD